MTDTSVFILTAGILFTIWLYLSYKRKSLFFQKMGLSGPKPIPLFGTTFALMNKKPWDTKRIWINEYGRVHGHYSGNKPQLFVSDAEVAQQITTKDFDSFVNHDFDISNKYRDKFLISLKDNHWRRVRALMSPTFTSSKMRRMFELMDDCCVDLVDIFEEHRIINETSNVREIFDFYTLDTIATCCYGFKLRRRNLLGGKTNESVAAASEEFVRDAKLVTNIQIWRVVLKLTLPSFIFRLTGLETYPVRLYEPIADKAAKIIKARRRMSDSSQFSDYLQCLLDAKLGQKLDLGDEIGKHEDHHAALSDSNALDDQRRLLEHIKLNQQINESKVTLTDEEILSSAIFFLTVGIETTSNLLTNIVYVLAWKPSIQDQLFKELSRLAKIKDTEDKSDNSRWEFDYNSLTSAQYLDAVISETLRFIPIITEIDRVTNRDCHINKLGIIVPKGLKIALNYGCIMGDPEYWPEPDKFDPNRFLPENKHKIVPGSYCPFGLGPRHCIGMRFALTETKLAIARLIMRYKFIPAPDTTFPPVFGGHTAMKWIKNPIIKIATRD